MQALQQKESYTPLRPLQYFLSQERLYLSWRMNLLEKKYTEVTGLFIDARMICWKLFE